VISERATVAAASKLAPGSGGFAPLRRPVFAVLWAATVLGNTGTFMRDVASSWLVADLSGSPAAVAMVQAAGSLPIFLLAIPAGVLSDILDRRKFLIVVQVGLAAVSGALMLLALTGALSVTSLVALTFLGGVGAALMSPTWQSIVPELVPNAELKKISATKRTIGLRCGQRSRTRTSLSPSPAFQQGRAIQAF
jgi:MFS family permease